MGTGEYTANNIFYKSAYGARGMSEKALFDAQLDAADSFLTSLQVAATSLQGLIDDIQLAMENFVTLTGAQTITNKNIVPRLVTVASAAAPAPNIDTTDIFYITALAGTANFSAPVGTPESGQKLIIMIRDNGTKQALTWAEVYDGAGAVLPLTTTLGVSIYLEFFYNTTTAKWELYTMSGLFG